VEDDLALDLSDEGGIDPGASDPEAMDLGADHPAELDLAFDDEDPNPAADVAEIDDVDPTDDPVEPRIASKLDPPAGEDTGVPSSPSAASSEEADPVTGGDGFDLAAELSDVFGDDSSSDSLGGSTDDGFSAVFDAFKQGVSEALSETDHEAHYDLGIAYKEMELFDDAIQEFRAAMVHPPRVVECLHLIGLCSLDAGRVDVAIEHLEQLLETEGVTGEQGVAGRFDLARAYAEAGRVEDARGAFQAVLDAAPGYQDAAARLTDLKGPEAEVPAEKETPDFESFEDFLADVADEPDGLTEPEPETEPAEARDGSPEDLSAMDADALPTPDSVASDPGEPAGEPEVRPVVTPAPTRSRKKKISFL
jgi:hypothetical protein